MSFLPIVLGFAFLIFIHELGHFLVARWCGIRCPQFAIGFGQALLSWRKGMGFKAGSTEEDYAARAFAELEKTRGPLDADARTKVDVADLHAAADTLGLGQTEYRLNWLPLGGYVKMVGQEDTDPNAKSKDPAAFSNKSAKARAAVLVAGVVMNLITGLIFLVAAFTGGVEFPAATVGQVQHGSPAEKAGLQVGDRITAVDGTKVTDFVDLKMQVVLSDGKTPLKLEVLRDGKAQVIEAVPAYNPAQGMQTLGMAPPLSLEVMAFEKGGTPASFQPGAKITTAGGQPVADYGALDRMIQASEGRNLELGLSDGSAATLTLMGDQELGSAVGLAPATRISAVGDGSPAQKAGLMAGDVLVAVGDAQWPTPTEAQAAIKAVGKGILSLKVLRNDKQLGFMGVQPKPTGKLAFLGLGERFLGIAMEQAADLDRISIIAPTLAPRGSRLLAVAGEPVKNWNDVQRLLVAHRQDNAVALSLVPAIGTQPVPEQAQLPLGPAAKDALAHAAWQAKNIAFAPATTRVRGENMLDSAKIGCAKTRDAVVQTYITIARLIQGKVGSENINGVIGIVHGGSRVAETGDPLRMFYLLGIISINLAVMNLLPIPVLDGGHLVFLAYEKITGKPLPEKAQTVAFIIGLSILGSLMLYATWNDLVRLLN